jgi:hypothetical protein
MNNELQILSTPKNLVQLDKAGITDVARQIQNAVAEGLIDPADALIYAKKGEAMFKEIGDNVKGYAYSKDYGKNYARFGAVLTQTELGVKWDYSNCNDPELTKLQQAFNESKKALEDRQKYLKTLKKSQTIVDEDSGEIVTIYPPVKTSTLGYSCEVK